VHHWPGLIFGEGGSRPTPPPVIFPGERTPLPPWRGVGGQPPLRSRSCQLVRACGCSRERITTPEDSRRGGGFFAEGDRGVGQEPPWLGWCRAGRWDRLWFWGGGAQGRWGAGGVRRGDGEMMMRWGLENSFYSFFSNFFFAYEYIDKC
jgi:hypothetical protein